MLLQLYYKILQTAVSKKLNQKKVLIFFYKYKYNNFLIIIWLLSLCL